MFNSRSKRNAAILLWQLDSRKVPFDKQHPQTVMYQVVAAGVRPRPPVGAESFVNISSFMSLYKSCWNPISAARPSAKVKRECNFNLIVGERLKSRQDLLMLKVKLFKKKREEIPTD